MSTTSALREGAAAPAASGGLGRPRPARAGRSHIVLAPQGDIEYTIAGSGPPVLVLHGSGGGYDQGEILGETALGDGFRRITPSRFGYLRSTFSRVATFDDQAHAYATLLDHLAIDDVAVVAVSHGGPSALLFAVLYPERVQSLTLLSCGVAPSSTAEQARANAKGALLTTLFRHDFALRAFTALFKRRLMRLMGADDEVIARLTPEERRAVERIIGSMTPASPRAAGVAFDNAATLPGERIAAVRAPTLIVHARDDPLQLYHNAEFAGRTIPGARLVTFERGGHLLLAIEKAAVRRQVQRHVLDHDTRRAGAHRALPPRLPVTARVDCRR